MTSAILGRTNNRFSFFELKPEVALLPPVILLRKEKVILPNIMYVRKFVFFLLYKLCILLYNIRKFW